MPKIAISYRREDSAAITGRIFDRLTAQYGSDSVFRDIDNIPLGVDFREHIDAMLAETDVTLVIIGKRWLGPGRGRTRINDPADPVRVEVATALRIGKPVIPVLVDGSGMPKADQLPDLLKDLIYRNGLDVDSGRDFDQHIERLIRNMDLILARISRQRAEEEKQRAETARRAEEEKQRAETARRAEEEKQRAEAARLAEEQQPTGAARLAEIPNQLELTLDPNGEHIRLTWRTGRGAFSKPLRLASDLLRKQSRGVREALNELNSYVRTNPKLEEERDPGWQRYVHVIRKLRQRGQALRNALLNEDDVRSLELTRAIESLQPGAEIRVNCSDDEESLPLGFVFEGEVEASVAKPSRSDFTLFWLDRFKITMLVQGGGCMDDSLVVNPESLKFLYILHRTEVENALPYLGIDAPRLKWLTSLPVKDYYNWNTAKRAWENISNAESIVFVFAHSDGDYLSFGDSSVDWNTFRMHLHKNRSASHPVLLILNCSLSASGGEGGSLLSVAARRGVCGFIGTEAEILNTYALRCGTRLMWELCANGLTLGTALDRMQEAEDLFPLNLFYTCYAERGFRLRRPLDPPKPA